MTKQDTTAEAPLVSDRAENPRRFAVSANRGHARHRLRYVETGGAAVDMEECNFCQAVPEPDDDSPRDQEDVTSS